MKKILIIAVALLAGGISAAAQNFSFGGGFMNSSVYYENSTNASNGFYVQATAEANLSNAFAVVGGLRYAMTSGEYISGYAKTQNMYVGVPVFAKVNVINTGDFKLFAFAGPTAYYGISSKADALGVSVNLYDHDLVNRFNVTVGGGIGVDAMEVIRFTLGYDYGLMDKMDNIKSKTGDIRIGVAYLF